MQTSICDVPSGRNEDVRVCGTETSSGGGSEGPAHLADSPCLGLTGRASGPDGSRVTPQAVRNGIPEREAPPCADDVVRSRWRSSAPKGNRKSPLQDGGRRLRVGAGDHALLLGALPRRPLLQEGAPTDASHPLHHPKTHVLGAVVCAQFGVSTIIGEMIIGVILGPNGVDLVPYEQFFRLAGVFGVRPIAPRRPGPAAALALLPSCANRLSGARRSP